MIRQAPIPPNQGNHNRTATPIAYSNYSTTTNTTTSSTTATAATSNNAPPKAFSKSIEAKHKADEEKAAAAGKEIIPL